MTNNKVIMAEICLAGIAVLLVGSNSSCGGPVASRANPPRESELEAAPDNSFSQLLHQAGHCAPFSKLHLVSIVRVMTDGYFCMSQANEA